MSSLRSLRTLALVLCAGCGRYNDVLIERRDSGADGSAPTGASVPPVLSGRVTLRIDDPFQDSYDFERATYGSVIQDGQVKNAGRHIAYQLSQTRERGELRAGIQGGETGAIVDLGTDDDVASRTGTPQTGSGGNGFASISFDGATFNDPEASALFAESAASSAAVLNRHVYVLRIVRFSPPAADLLVKLFVVSFVEKSEVSFEWIRFP